MKNFTKIRKSVVILALVMFISSTMLVFSGSLLAQDNKTVVKQEAKIEQADAKADQKTADKKVVKIAVKGSDKKGKFFFKKQCKSCHGKKGDGGDITPLSKTIKQWERYFKKDKHAKKKLSEEFEAEHLIHIRTFLINHAADSDQPETCG